MAHEVFISHSVKDKVTADAVCAMLESNGIRCWIAPRDVMPGMEWGASIIGAIKQARVMVLVFTASANSSPQIRKELERAVHHEVVILPFRVENVIPDEALEYFIGNVHWLDALTPPLEAHLKNLAGTIKTLLARTEPRDAPPLPKTTRGEAPDVRKPPEPTTVPPAAEPVTAAVSALASAAVSKHAKAPSVGTGPLPSGQRSQAARVGSKSYAAGQNLARILRSRTLAILGAAFALTVLLAVISIHMASWSARSSGTTQSLYSIFATANGKRLWVVGEAGTILGSEDGGATWIARNSGTTNYLPSIFGTSDGSRAWTVGQNGTILESDDGGATWTARNSGTTETLHSIFGTSDGQRLWTVGTGGTILESDNGGATWIARNSGTRNYFLKIFGAADGYSLWAASGDGTIVESDDGGASWKAQNSRPTDHLNSICGTSDGQRLWAVGYLGSIVESDDEGATWRALDSGTQDTLASIFCTGDGKRLWATGNASIFESDDGGATWTARKSGTTEGLASIFGTSDGKRLWAVGDHGTILESDRLF